MKVNNNSQLDNSKCHQECPDGEAHGAVHGEPWVLTQDGEAWVHTLDGEDHGVVHMAEIGADNPG